MARILLIEDDADNISLLTRLLKHHGHEISVADDAATGYDLAVAEKPELILMDLELPPEPDERPDPNAGLDATRRIKANDEIKDHSSDCLDCAHHGAASGENHGSGLR